MDTANFDWCALLFNTVSSPSKVGLQFVMVFLRRFTQTDYFLYQCSAMIYHFISDFFQLETLLEFVQERNF